MKSFRGAAIVAACFAASVSAFAATESSSCVTGSGNARIAWTAPAGEAVHTVRAYFRSDLATAEHFVELRRGAGNAYAGVLPRVSNAANAIEYRIATTLPDGKFTTRSSGRVSVASTCTAEAPASSDLQLAKAIIVGSTSEGPAIPAGFRCEGIIGRVTAKGELKSYAACSELAAAAAANAQSPAMQTASATSAIANGTSSVAKAKSASAPALATTDGVTANATRNERKPPVNPPPPDDPRVSNSRPH